MQEKPRKSLHDQVFHGLSVTRLRVLRLIEVEGTDMMSMLVNVMNETGESREGLQSPLFFALTSILDLLVTVPAVILKERLWPAPQEGPGNLVSVQLILVPGRHLCQSSGSPSAYHATEDGTFSSPPPRFHQAARHPHSAGTRQLSRTGTQ